MSDDIFEERHKQAQLVTCVVAAEEAFRVLSAVHDGIPDAPDLVTAKAAAFAVMNDAAALTRRLRGLSRFIKD